MVDALGFNGFCCEKKPEFTRTRNEEEN